MINEGTIQKIDFDKVQFTGSYDTVAENFGTLATGGSGSINITLVDFSVVMVFNIPNGNTVSFIYNNFGYDASSVIFVKNMFFGGNITTKGWEVHAFNTNLNPNIQYQFINYSHHSKMKFDIGTIHSGHMYYEMFTNASSSNTDKGDVSCSTPYFAKIVKDHCSNTSTVRPFVEFNSDDGSEFVFEQRFTDPPGDCHYIFKETMTWDNMRISIKTNGKGGVEISPFHSSKILYINIELTMTVSKTGNWGNGLVRQPRGNLVL